MVINPGIGYTSDVLSADFASVVLQKRDVFWKTMTAVLTVGFICLGFGMFTLMRKSHACSRFANLKYFENLILYAMPIVGNILFLPIISYLLDIFSCVEAIGDELSDSFLSKDCLEFC